jgi:16S rRNA (guanine527-N7)-methyltransferase
VDDDRPPPSPAAALRPVIERARRLGLIGPTPTEAIVEHALGFAARGPAPDVALDLGSGAGIPGLVLALEWPRSSWTLVDVGERRAAFLDQAIRDLDLHDRVAVRHAAAENEARGPRRHQADLVVARSFAPPAVTAECAAGFLRPGGRLVVSEPPDDSGRWVGVHDSGLGMELGERWTTDSGTYQSLRQRSPCPDRFPRRAGVPAKRPLF